MDNCSVLVFKNENLKHAKKTFKIVLQSCTPQLKNDNLSYTDPFKTPFNKLKLIYRVNQTVS